MTDRRKHFGEMGARRQPTARGNLITGAGVNRTVPVYGIEHATAEIIRQEAGFRLAARADTPHVKPGTQHQPTA